MDFKSGNDTTFQSFPSDLQQHLEKLIPSHLKVQSSLYPTYKSVKPISFATHNFLSWLSMQPKGPVILLSHSMGGLLAADAATHASNKARCIIGIVAFDTPYLGMHPHVIVSGIASLFPKDDEAKKKRTVKEMNEEHVQMVDDGVTDDWAAFKKDMPKPEGYKSSISLVSRSPSPSPQTESSKHRTFSPPHFKDSSYLVDSTLSHAFIAGPLNFLSAHTDDPVVRWARKHSDAPFTAGRKWIVEHFQFGSCMFDYTGLKERYARLVGWDGLWTNYWTETLPRRKENGAVAIEEGSEKDKLEARDRANDAALMETGIVEVPEISALKSHNPQETKAAQNAGTKAVQKAENARLKDEETSLKKGIIPPRHFIVLPTGLGRRLGGGDKWEKVVIGGVHDEVAAHCGLFIRNQNLDYDGLVERVGQRVLSWCETI